MLAVRKQVATMGKPPAKKQRQPLGTEGFLPPMASKTVELSVLNHKEWNAANKHISRKWTCNSRASR